MYLVLAKAFYSLILGLNFSSREKTMIIKYFIMYINKIELTINASNKILISKNQIQIKS